MKKRIWIISELFYPEETSTAYIFGEIANSLSSKYEVNVITGPEIYDHKKVQEKNPVNQLDDRIIIHRVDGIKENKKKILSRIKKFIGISKRIYKVAKKKIRKEDIVLLATNPFPLIVPMAKLHKRTGFNFIVLVHDVFPEPLKIRIPIPSIIYNPIFKIFSRSYAEADCLISLGIDMTKNLRNKTEKYNPSQNIIQIENWGDTEFIFPTDRNKALPSDKIVIQYAGNMGKAQGLEKIINEFSKIKNPCVLLDFWGGGEQEEKLKELVKELGLGHRITFNGTYKRSKQLEVLNKCDLALVKLRKEIKGLGVPSKTYNILAAGKPIIFIGPKDSEIALMIKENEIGFVFDEDENNGLIDFLNEIKPSDINRLKEMGKKARKLVETKYSKSIILNKINNAIG